jgi:magnesium transporter
MNELFMVYFDTEARTTEQINGDRLHALWEQPSGFFWIDINNPDVSVLNELLTSMEITCIWTNHFDSPEILPHLHDTPAAISFYLFDIENAESLGDTSQDIQQFIQKPVLIIIGKRFIITYHQDKVDLIHYVKKDYEANFKLAGKTPGFVLFLLFQHSLYNYARLNLMNDNFLDDLEFGMLSGGSLANIQRISTAGYNILSLKKLNANLHIILLMLVSKQSYTISAEARASFTEILKETISIRESIDSSRYLLDSIIAAIDAESSRKTSEIIRVLTITSCIFMPLTLITGIYGMNFQFMPGLDFEFGFILALGGMTAIAIGFLFILKKLGWLSAKVNK